MATVTAVQADATARGRRQARLGAVAVAVLAALVVWAAAVFVLGIDVQEPPRSASQPTRDLAAANVVIASMVASFAGWGLLAVLERLTARARTIWAIAAAVVAVASLGAPLLTPGITSDTRAVLVVLHLVVGAALIPLLSRTSPGGRRS